MPRPFEPHRKADAEQDPDLDAAIRAALSDVTSEMWDEIRRALAGVEALPEDGYCIWHGGRQLDGSLVLPWAEYVREVERLLNAMRRAGLVVPFAWPDWDGIERHRGGKAMAEAPVEDAVRMVTAVLRSERFTDGSIGGALQDDTLPAAVRRLLAWSGDPGRSRPDAGPRPRQPRP